jgi:hypothetical protein
MFTYRLGVVTIHDNSNSRARSAGTASLNRGARPEAAEPLTGLLAWLEAAPPGSHFGLAR